MDLRLSDHNQFIIMSVAVNKEKQEKLSKRIQLGRRTRNEGWICLWMGTI
jgi:hypothetical protein